MKSMLGMCFNWKVLAFLGIVGAAVLVLAPGAALAFLPLLLLAACPLSMVAMMFAMRGMHGGKDNGEKVTGQSQQELQERLAQLSEERRQVEAQLAAEPAERASHGVPAEAKR